MEQTDVKPTKSTCRYCGVKISFFRRIGGAQFCSPQHEDKHGRRLGQMILSRLDEAAFPRGPVRPAGFLNAPHAGIPGQAACSWHGTMLAPGLSLKMPVNPECLEISVRLRESMGPDRLFAPASVKPEIRGAATGWMRNRKSLSLGLPALAEEEEWKYRNVSYIRREMAA